MSEEQMQARRAPAQTAADEERLAALDDLPETDPAREPGPEGFAAAAGDVFALHGDLLARLAQ
jgi:hypothetical protein